MNKDKTCVVLGCAAMVRARDLCNMHYQRNKIYGDPLFHPPDLPREQWQHLQPGYGSWNAMKRRCHAPLDKDYGRYGARGVRVCERWRKSFKTFIADVGAPPSDTHSIERVDNNGNYEPGNVRWATPLEQARNRRGNRPLTVNSETHCLSEWEELKGLPPRLIARRLRQGWPENERLLTPPRSMPPRELWNRKEQANDNRSSTK